MEMAPTITTVAARRGWRRYRDRADGTDGDGEVAAYSRLE